MPAGVAIFKAMARSEWLDELPDALRSSVLSLYGVRGIFHLRRAILPHSFQVSASVTTRDRGDLEVFVECTGFDLAHIQTECTCQVRRNCKHAYAALLAGITRFYMPREDLPERTDFTIEQNPLRTTPATEGKEGVPPASALPPGTATPVLRLMADYPFTGYVGWYSGIPYGEKVRLLRLAFSYAENPGHLHGLGEGPADGETWRRDLEFERVCLRRLETFGFKRCGEALNFSLKTELREALVAPMNGDAQNVWMEFLLDHTAQLRAEGWSIETDESFDLHIIQPEYFYEEIEETNRPNWFAADVGMEVNGARLPLLPLIVRLLTTSPHLLRTGRLATMGDKPVLIPLEDGRSHIPVPASRLHRILTSLTELLTSGTKGLQGHKIVLHRLRAAAYASIPEDDALCRRTAARLRDLAEGIRSGNFQHASPLPGGLKATLRPYQNDGFQWLQFLSRHGLGGILADDMGLGKTVQTLAHLLAEKENSGGQPNLIVCPTSLLSNWRDEAARFTPELRVHIHHGTQRAASLKDAAACDLLITSYPLLGRDEEALAAMTFHAVVLDEAQYIKNPRTVAAQAACKLQSTLRICLTGTPMENHLGELWSIFHFLMPGFLGTWDQFTAGFRTPIEKENDAERRQMLSRRITPVFLRRTKENVLKELPPKVETVQRIPLSPAQADLYESVRAAMDKRIHEELERSDIGQSRIYILDALLKLRQVCCHPPLLKTQSASTVTDSAKLEAFMELVVPLVEEGRRVLVFSQFVEMLRVLSSRLRGEKIAHLMLTGETKNRGDLVNQFQQGVAPVFLISLKAGGTGLNLTAADTVIHYDPWWNPAAENQATDRAHRIGQQGTVFVHKLICEGTIEERILELQKKKAALVGSLLNGSATSLAAMDASDLEFLLAPVQ